MSDNAPLPSPQPAAITGRRSRKKAAPAASERLQLEIVSPEPAPGVDRAQLRERFMRYLARQIARDVAAELGLQQPGGAAAAQDHSTTGAA